MNGSYHGLALTLGIIQKASMVQEDLGWPVTLEQNIYIKTKTFVSLRIYDNIFFT